MYDMSLASASWPRTSGNKGFEMFLELVKSVLSTMSLLNGAVALITTVAVMQDRHQLRALTCQHVPAGCETGPNCNLLALSTEG